MLVALDEIQGKEQINIINPEGVECDFGYFILKKFKINYAYHHCTKCF